MQSDMEINLLSKMTNAMNSTNGEKHYNIED